MSVDDSQGVTDVAVESLSKVFAMVEGWRERIHVHPPAPESGSCLAGDDQVTDPFRLSHAVIQVLISAVDHFETLRSVVQEQHVLPARGGFTLLRAVLENAAVAVWLLAPASRNERVLRLLRWEWADAVDEANILGLMAGMPVNAHRAAEIRTSATVGRDERKNQLRALATARDMSSNEVSAVAERAVRWHEIIGAAGEEAHGLTGERAKWAWMVCSGLAHSRRWAVLAFLKRKVTPGAADDLHNVKISADEERLAVMANVAAVMLGEAWRLFDERRCSGMAS